MAKTRNRYLERYIRTIKEAHDHGFTVDILVEIALAGIDLPPPHSPEDREIIKQVYLDALSKELRA